MWNILRSKFFKILTIQQIQWAKRHDQAFHGRNMKDSDICKKCLTLLVIKEIYTQKIRWYLAPIKLGNRKKGNTKFW